MPEVTTWFKVWWRANALRSPVASPNKKGKWLLLTGKQLKKKSRKSEAKEITIYTQVESREEGGSDWTLDTESLTGVSLEEAEAAVRLEKTRVELSPIDFSVSSSEA
nr:hypothetical protein Iba_chr10dCG11330 [Ipomoea batatas]GMD47303.1 hypothetical protein Iba_chr10eCG11620 [Ipomoea batatas]